MNERPYFYGQGKVWLARRNAQGQPLAARWVGDVSELNLNMEFEETVTRHSIGGVLVPAQRYITYTGGTIDSVWHEFSDENFSAIFAGDTVTGLPDEISAEALPTGIQAGERYFLKYQQIWHVRINGMTEGTHFTVDKQFGAIDFITTPARQPVLVDYERAGNVSTALFNKQSEEFFFRYEGINLAENNRPVVVELYRIVLSPPEELALINSDNTIGGMNVSGTLLADLTRRNLPGWGRFGRVVNIEPLSGLNYDGEAIHDGKYNY